MYLRKISKSTQAENQRLLFDRMSLAISRIEQAYRPGHVFTGADEVTRQDLDRMDLRTIEDIVDWEFSWLKLLGEK